MISGICLLMYGCWKLVWDSVTLDLSFMGRCQDQNIPSVHKEKVERNPSDQSVKIVNEFVFSLLIRFLPVL